MTESSDRVVAALEARGSRRQGRDYQCPAHDDRNASLSVTAEGDRVLLHCHAGCTTESVVAELGLAMGDLFDEPRQTRAGEPTATFDYKDEAGELLYQVVRLPGKKFRQRRSVGGGWEWDLNGTRRLLYRLPELLASDQARHVFVVEGEGDVETLRSVKLVATTNSGGADGWRSDLAAPLIGRSVVVLPDNDEPGRKRGARVATDALAAGAKAVRVVELPGLSESGDVTDWLAAGHTVKELKALVLAEPPAPIQGVAVGTPSSETLAAAPESGEPHPLTDIANGKRFVAQHGTEVRYNADWGRWLCWDGYRWHEDAKVAVEALAKTTAVAIWDEAKKDRSKELVAWAVKSEGVHGIHGMLEMACSEYPVVVKTKDLDRDPWLLNTPSGTIDLQTGMQRPAERGDLITKMTGAAYDPEAKCPRWEQFLEEVFTRADLTPNHDVIEYIRRLVGYTLTSSTREQMFAILYGAGRNGKGVFTNTLRYMLGDYAGVTPADTLLSKRSDPHPTAVADLYGHRLVISAETDQGRRLDEALLKNLTGSDPIKARRMHENLWEYVPAFKLFLATNHKPGVRGTDEGIWSRIHMIPFLRTFAPADATRVPAGTLRADDGLEDALRGEWPGILAWAVRGCLEWQKGRLRPPAAVVEATATYRAENDAIQRFIDDECDTSERDVFVSAAKLFASYRNWCDRGGEYQMSTTAFGTELTRIGFPAGLQRIATLPTKTRHHIRLNEDGLP